MNTARLNGKILCSICIVSEFSDENVLSLLSSADSAVFVEFVEFTTELQASISTSISLHVVLKSCPCCGFLYACPGMCSNRWHMLLEHYSQSQICTLELCGDPKLNRLQLL